MKDNRTTFVYRRRESHPFRWLLAAIAFTLAMTITFEQADSPTLDQEFYNTSDLTQTDNEQLFQKDILESHFRK